MNSPVLPLVDRRHSGRRPLLLAALIAVVCLAAPWAARPVAAGAGPAASHESAAPRSPAAQPPAATEPPPQTATGASLARPSEGEGAKQASEGHGTEEARPEPIWALVARLFNFALLVGALVYLLRSPLMTYLENRGAAIRSGVTRAAEMREDAAARLEQIDQRLKALPAELEALKRRGAEEIAAEESRIGELADAERRRILDQAGREIESQLRAAERDLRRRAGELAVAIATERVKRTITDQDQVRLVERYLARVRSGPVPGS